MTLAITTAIFDPGTGRAPDLGPHLADEEVDYTMSFREWLANQPVSTVLTDGAVEVSAEAEEVGSRVVTNEAVIVRLRNVTAPALVKITATTDAGEMPVGMFRVHPGAIQ